MTGRARGRARGRSRGTAATDTRRPGEKPPPAATQAEQPPQVGRGRGRAAVQQQQQQQAQSKPKQTAAAPVEQMQQLSVQEPMERGGGGGGGGGEGARKPGGDVTRPPGRGGRGMPFEEPHTRPQHIQDKCGKSGSGVNLLSNYIPLRNRPNCAIYQYNVSFSPPVESKRRRLGIFYSQRALIGPVDAFDGTILYLPHRLPQDTTEVVVASERDDSRTTVTITLTNELHATSPVCLQLFNIIFRRILGMLDMRQIGRHYYNNKIPIKIQQHKLELWPGFITSILQYENDVMLCADISHKILRTDTVYDYLNELYGELQSRGRTDHFHDRAAKALIGEIVLTRYNNKTYRIDDIDWDKNPQCTFSTSRGEVSFTEYYSKCYGVTLSDLEQPLLLSRPKQREIRARGGDDSPVLLIPELCTRTGLSEEARADFRIMKDLAVHTRVGPGQRRDTLMKFINQLHTEPKVVEHLAGWNLDFAKDLIQLQGRTLPAEKIYQQQRELRYKPHEADWGREMRGNKLITPVDLTNFMIVFTQRDYDKASDFVRTLSTVGPPMGINIGNPETVELQNDRIDSFMRAIESHLTPKTQMVIVVLPSSKKALYDAVKKLCCVDYPVPSQCLLAKTLSKQKMLMSVTTKVAMQLNCKLGGELWAVEIPLKKMMVVGIDSYHDSAKRGRSVGGFIASLNHSLTKYYSQCMFQHTGQELADNLKVCMAAALRKFAEVNGSLPERIMVYRDGVGDGQLAAVVEHEVPQMTDAFKQTSPDYKPKFTVIVVKKRISTRLFAARGRDLSNPPPGTVVDTKVTKPEWYDFFLVSQAVSQGTVTPTHFNIVCDNSGLQPDHMQRLTYKLCHLYYNWPGTVRVPAPCQYAHKLAFLVGQSIHMEPKMDLADRLYFL